ncbi:NAD(P)/FAD-dependent oxidoreductase [Henriciella sp. AS95]|uniref:FAD-dependent oxidoreductase n=1 Tax=Henriciella sp. AS95 TaxID=3135782 RepID=UPI00316E43FE
MVRKLDIAVCGAGIGGLSAAILLARQGNRVTLFDQYAETGPVGSGLMLQSTGLAVLGAMGLSERVLALGSRLERLWGKSTPKDRTVLDVRFEKLRAGHFGLGVQRQMLFDTLYDAAMAENVPLETSRRIESVDRQSGQIIFETGQFVGGFDLVVDALGVRSPLTRAPKRELAYGALWTTLPWPGDGPFDKTALEQRYRAARQMAGVMASGRVDDSAPESLTYFWSIRIDQYERWRATSLDSWKADAETLWPQTRPLLDQIDSHDQMVFARYRHRTHPDPVGGPKLVHIGDAWHAASPQLGQGANMALLDAYALALALDVTNEVSLALARYRSLRKSHIGLYQMMSWLFTPVYQGDSRVMAWLRDYLAAPLTRIPPAPKLLAGMVTGAFGSPLKDLGLRD